MLSELPFFTLDSQEFLKITGGWVHHSFQSLIESKDLFGDIITSSERESELQESLDNNYTQSNYFTIKQSRKFFYETKKHHGFSIIHLNMRSLPKNLASLEDIILTVKGTPEIIAISETKLQEKNIYNISIPGYVFLNTNSPTSAGGVGLYISEELSFIRRRDLALSDDGIESCWVEITRKKTKEHSNLFSLHIYCRDHEGLSYGRNPLPAPTIAMPRRHRTSPKQRHTSGGKHHVTPEKRLKLLYSTNTLPITQTPIHLMAGKLTLWNEETEVRERSDY